MVVARGTNGWWKAQNRRVGKARMLLTHNILDRPKARCAHAFARVSVDAWAKAPLRATYVFHPCPGRLCPPYNAAILLTLVTSLPAVRIRSIASASGSIATAM